RVLDPHEDPIVRPAPFANICAVRVVCWDGDRLDGMPNVETEAMADCVLIIGGLLDQLRVRLLKLLAHEFRLLRRKPPPLAPVCLPEPAILLLPIEQSIHDPFEAFLDGSELFRGTSALQPSAEREAHTEFFVGS